MRSPSRSLPSKILTLSGSAFYSSPAGLPDEAVKHVAKSPSMNIGGEAESAKLVLDLLIPARTKSPSSVSICRLSLHFNLRCYGLHSPLAVRSSPLSIGKMLGCLILIERKISSMRSTVNRPSWANCVSAKYFTGTRESAVRRHLFTANVTVMRQRPNRPGCCVAPGDM